MGTLLTKQSGWLVLQAFVVFCCFAQISLSLPSADHFTAAVYNHRTISPAGPEKPNWDYAKAIIAQNLQVYEQQIEEAAKQGTNIIVFPEDGIFGVSFSRADIYHYLEHVPDPDAATINPCTDYVDPTEQPIQYRMSCAAKKHNMWIVVNMGDVQNCTKLQEPNCPSDGRFQFNTNIVFNSQGDLVARYHKRNLFFEFQFDIPEDVEYAVFDTPYGRMGMFVCFDILFKEPAVDLVEVYDIAHALFPTAWRSIIPSMSGLGFHESWAIRFGVNLLSSEFHLPELDFIGSAVYRGAMGAENFYNDYSFMSPGKLLVTRIPTEPVRPQQGIVEVPKLTITQQNFTSVMESNLYTWLNLEEDEGELYLHEQNTSCYLRYKMAQSSDEDIYAFGIFEGQHFDYINSYIQVCALIRCSGLDNPSCGIPTREAHTVFEEVHLAGRFDVDYIFPALLVDNGDIQKHAWDFTLDSDNNGGLISAEHMDRPLLSAILYTRDYSRDNNTGFERPPVSVGEDIGEFSVFRTDNQDSESAVAKEDLELLQSYNDIWLSENKDHGEGGSSSLILASSALGMCLCIGMILLVVVNKKKFGTVG